MVFIGDYSFSEWNYRYFMLGEDREILPSSNNWSVSELSQLHLNRRTSRWLRMSKWMNHCSNFPSSNIGVLQFCRSTSCSWCRWIEVLLQDSRTLSKWNNQPSLHVGKKVILEFVGHKMMIALSKLWLDSPWHFYCLLTENNSQVLSIYPRVISRESRVKPLSYL